MVDPMTGAFTGDTPTVIRVVPGESVQTLPEIGPTEVPFFVNRVNSFGEGTGDWTVIHETTAAPDPASEPASLTLLGIGAAGLLGYAWRRWKAPA